MLSNIFQGWIESLWVFLYQKKEGVTLNKRYQVFISSTYNDLQDERQEVMQALLELDCIPSGMELFPAANEDQWTLIKKVIDDCDYYVVIIGGRYGTIGASGLSYTEMEYRYALDSGKPIIGFIHKDPGELPANRTEQSVEGRNKLDDFRKLVQKKMVKYWTSPVDLGSVVSRGLIWLIKNNEAIGWVRGNEVPAEDTAQEILNLRKQVDQLENMLSEARFKAPEGTDELSQGQDIYIVNYTFEVSRGVSDITYADEFETTWNDIFYTVSPLMINEVSEWGLKRCLDGFVEKHCRSIHEENYKKCDVSEFSILNDDFQTIKIQLRALGLIAKSQKNRSVKDTQTYWTLTPYGDTVMTKLRAIKRH